MMPMEHVIPYLRDAVGPVILISGVGLLLLTMTNRLGRAIDRSRILKQGLAKAVDKERDVIQSQIDILYRRAKIVRLSILFSVMSALLAALLMISIFMANSFGGIFVWVAAVIFFACLISLSISLVAFLCDINLSLHALKLELEKSD
jgi:hypothetical protein